MKGSTPLPGRRPTSLDVARKAGVSQSAVSRAFGDGSVHPQTKDRIMAAASQLGYHGNAFARSLTTRRSNMIGLVMGDLPNPFYPEVLELLTRKFQDLGQRMLLHTVGHGDDVDILIPDLLRYQIDGVMITSAMLSSRMAAECQKRQTPVVVVNRRMQAENVSCVAFDNVECGRLAADCFLEAGHRRFGFIAGHENTSTSLHRMKGFVDRLEENGHSGVEQIGGGFTYQGGYDATLALFAGPNRPDAIFCANDIMAMGALDAARIELGLDVPGDVAIIGCDDIRAAHWRSYDLTTIRQPREQLVDVATSVLLDTIENPGRDPVTRIIPGTLVTRGTTRSRDP